MKSRTQCPACLSSSVTVAYEEPYQGAGIQGYLKTHYEGRATASADAYTFRIGRCGDCGLAFQQQVPDDELLGELYNHWVPSTGLERNHRDYNLDQYRNLAEQVQFVIAYFGLPPSQLNVLDFGFGWAHFARMAMGYGCAVSGIELSAERRSHGESVGIRVVDLEDLPPQQYRFINAEQVFEHLTEPRAVLEQLMASLAPDGIVKINVPNAVASLKKLGCGTGFGDLSPDEQMAVAPLEHINAFCADSLEAFGKTVGLKPLRPSFRQLYNSASGLLEPKTLARTLLRPVYRHVYPRSTFMYFRRA